MTYGLLGKGCFPVGLNPLPYWVVLSSAMESLRMTSKGYLLGFKAGASLKARGRGCDWFTDDFGSRGFKVARVRSLRAGFFF